MLYSQYGYYPFGNEYFSSARSPYDGAGFVMHSYISALQNYFNFAPRMHINPVNGYYHSPRFYPQLQQHYQQQVFYPRQDRFSFYQQPRYMGAQNYYGANAPRSRSVYGSSQYQSMRREPRYSREESDRIFREHFNVVEPSPKVEQVEKVQAKKKEEKPQTYDVTLRLAKDSWHRYLKTKLDSDEIIFDQNTNDFEIKFANKKQYDEFLAELKEEDEYLYNSLWVKAGKEGYQRINKDLEKEVQAFISTAEQKIGLTDNDFPGFHNKTEYDARLFTIHQQVVYYIKEHDPSIKYKYEENPDIKSSIFVMQQLTDEQKEKMLEHFSIHQAQVLTTLGMEANSDHQYWGRDNVRDQIVALVYDAYKNAKDSEKGSPEEAEALAKMHTNLHYLSLYTRWSLDDNSDNQLLRDVLTYRKGALEIDLHAEVLPEKIIDYYASKENNDKNKELLLRLIGKSNIENKDEISTYFHNDDMLGSRELMADIHNSTYTYLQGYYFRACTGRSQ